MWFFFHLFFHLQVGFSDGFGATATHIQIPIDWPNDTFPQLRIINLSFLLVSNLVA